ncbi:hypothetical protein PC128_g5401 [Phytophthora cactorum]|nr:hypothetical protein PC128_g5401 [Phytophthora cactorum]
MLETPAKMKAKKKRLSPSWLKRKRELEALREETEALEAHVEFLRIKRVPAEASSVNTFETLEQKAALDRERPICQAALDENRFLKSRLQVYVNLSGQLRTVLTAAEQQKTQLMIMSITAARTLRIESGAGYQLRLASPRVFDMLEKRVNARFRELEASFSDIQQRVPSADTELIQIYSKNGDRDTGIVESKRAQLLPFQETAISAIVWSIVELGGFPDSQDSRVIRRSEDVYAVDSRLTVCLGNGESVSLNTHSVMKRFVVSTGTVLLLESNSNWASDFEDSGSWVHTTDEGGCFVISSYALNGSRDPGDLSQLHSELTLKPSGPPENTSRYSKAGPRTVHDVVIPSFREIIESRHQFVENALFDCLRTTSVA